MAGDSPDPEDGSQPQGGTGQRQDHRAAPPGHKVPGEKANLDDPERASVEDDDEGDQADERS